MFSCFCIQNINIKFLLIEKSGSGLIPFNKLTMNQF